MSQLPTHCAPLDGEAGICPDCAKALLATITTQSAALRLAIPAMEGFLDAENPDMDKCDNPECKICPAMSAMYKSLTACREALGEQP